MHKDIVIINVLRLSACASWYISECKECTVSLLWPREVLLVPPRLSNIDSIKRWDIVWPRCLHVSLKHKDQADDGLWAKTRKRLKWQTEREVYKELNTFLTSHTPTSPMKWKPVMMIEYFLLIFCCCSYLCVWLNTCCSLQVRGQILLPYPLFAGRLCLQSLSSRWHVEWPSTSMYR